MNVGLGMIIKDEDQHLERILSKYRKYFGEVQITITSDLKIKELQNICEKYNCFHSYFKWIDDFSAARNFNMKQFKKSDYYFRLDADDDIENPEAIQEVYEKCKKQNISMVLAYYDYARDEDGNTNAAHYRESIIKLDENLFWNKEIHENIIPKNEKSYRVVKDNSYRYIHLNKDGSDSRMRNIKILLKEYNRDKENTDPRTLAYLGRMLHGIGEIDKALPILELHISKSGWDEDRYLSFTQIADIYMRKKDYDKAISACYEAITECPTYPDAYLKLHDIYFENSKWESAIHWGKIGCQANRPESTMLFDPSSYTWRPALSMSYCYLMLGKYDEAMKLFDYAKKLAPNCKFIVDNEKYYALGKRHNDYVQKFIWMLNFLRKSDPDKIVPLIYSIPQELSEHELLIAFKNQYLESKTWNDDSVVIHCGKVFEEWGPWSLKNGIGGSEEAVIHLSRELVNLGMKVTVYNECGDKEGNYDGVDYVNHYKFNPRDTFSTLISWRMNIFALGNIKAKNRWVWMHDVPQPGWFETEDEIKGIDKIIVLSNYHKSLFPKNIPDDKFLVSSNGLDRESIESLSGLDRDNKVIYGSSYDRGLLQLLEIWPDVMEAVPNAELHVYYGLNNVEKLAKTDKNVNDFLLNIKKLLNQNGVFDHGRVGQDELHAAYASSKVWAYPTSFPEISCITAMKAQALGCMVVSTDFAALNETVKTGVKVHGIGEDKNVLNEFKNNLIKALKGEYVAPDYNPPYWSEVAHQWAHYMSEGAKDKVLIRDRFDWIKSNIAKNETVVDIGGNDGHTFDDWDRSKVTTVDIDKYDIPNFVRANAEELPFEDNKFDVAVLAEILEHVEDPIKTLKEAKRVSKRVIITVPYEHDWKSHLDPFETVSSREEKYGKDRMEMAKEANPKCVEFDTSDNLEHLWHKRHYDNDLLKEHLSLAGFENAKIQKLVLGDWSFLGVCL